jgi:hypothetical protein
MASQGMLTIFSTTKPFRGNIGNIQRNAIRSWTLLQPRPEIIVIGNEPGTEDVCKEFGLRHVPEVLCNEFGTPLVCSLFALGQAHARFEIACYVNADIIFIQDFLDAVAAARNGTSNDFLLLGGRWNLRYVDPNLLDRPDRNEVLKAYASTHGVHDRRIAMDYFIFPRSFSWELPDFAIGRSAWDSWFPYHALRKGVPVIDGSNAITAIHQDHDYSHFYKQEASILHTAEGKQNMRLMGFGRRCLIASATLEITPHGLQRTNNRWKLLDDRLHEYELRLIYCLLSWKPYSSPLFFTLKAAKRGARWLGQRIHALLLARQRRRSGSLVSD